MIPFHEARQRILQAVAPLNDEAVPLDEIGGRVFAQDLVAPFDVPHFDNSQVDGYAIRAADQGPRRIVGVSAAGDSELPFVGSGEAVRIFTGAPIPPGADAVTMQEDVVLRGEAVEVPADLSAGAFVRRRGEEIALGTTFPVQGRAATPPLVGLAASFGLTELRVVQHPQVGIVATGSELVPPGFPLQEGQVFASNPAALEAAVRAIGIDSVRSWIVPDDSEATEAGLRLALDECDVVITVGGVSVGDRDLVRPALLGLGVREDFWRVSIKPGKPFYFGLRADDGPVFGLPGNPVSALVTFALFVRPALRRLIGLPPEEERVVRLGAPIRRKDLRYEFLRAILEGEVATPVEAQGSHMQTGLAFADVLIHVPDGVDRLEVGQDVTITPLAWS